MRRLCVVVCGAGPAPGVDTLVDAAIGAGWVVRVVPTPSAVEFLDIPALAERTGNPVLSEFRKPGTPRYGDDDAVIAAPITFNTLNKLALGIADTLALSVLGEAVGKGLPVVLVPSLNTALANRLPFRRAVAQLREEAAIVLLDHIREPGAGAPEEFPYAAGLAALEELWTIHSRQ